MRIEPGDEVKERLGDFDVYGARLLGLDVGPSSEEVGRRAREAERDVRESTTVDALKNDSIYGAFRDFFWRSGIDPTKTRPASEALARRVLHGSKLPSINSFVDSLNMASLKTKIPFAAFDDGMLEGAFVLRFATPGETILPIGREEQLVMEGNEIVISDEEKLIALYPHRDSDKTKITPKTRDAWIMSCGVPGLGSELLLSSLDTCIEEVRSACEGVVDPETYTETASGKH
jgi:DNA/RNA-binding domain of Phe-tRNA-synthetase-like protein